MLTKIPRVVDLSKQVLSTNRNMANTRMMLPSGRAKKLAETVLGKKAIDSSKLGPTAAILGGATLPLAVIQTDPKELGAAFASVQISLEDALQKISNSVEEASSIPQEYFIKVQEGYQAEKIRQSTSEPNLDPIELPPTIEEQAIQPVSLMFAKGGELDMQGTPMTPDLSEQMQPDMVDVSQAEIQEAQGALMQIVQVIKMLVDQGLSEDQIMEFLAQYGITEEELDQAAELLGVDIDALLSGQMEQSQEPMMMAAGGPGRLQEQPQPQQLAFGMSNMSDNEPMMQDMSPEQQMFSIDATIENLLKQYDISVNTGNIEDAMAISDQITNLSNQKIAISTQLDPVMMANGGVASTSIDPSYISEYLQMLEEKQAELFNLTRKAPGINPTGLSPDMSLAKRRQQFEAAKRDLRQATRALNPEVLEIYEAGQFRKLPTVFSKGAIEDYVNFVNQKKQTEKKN